MAAKDTLLLGHPRSGTTLLRRLLDAHPDICAPPESHLFGACARFLWSDRNSTGLEIGVLSGLAFAGFSEDQVLERLRVFAFSFLDDYASRCGKTRWVEKTAFDVFEINRIERLCGNLLNYLTLVRHPVDVALSTIEFCQQIGRYPSVLHPYIVRHPDPLHAFLHSWADTTRALINLSERRPDQVAICRYEDLVADPKVMLEGVLHFIGAEPFNEMGNLAGTNMPGFSDPKAFQSDRVEQSHQPRWRTLPERRLAEASPIVADLMAELGYEPLPDSWPLTQEDARRAYVIGLTSKPPLE